MPTTGRNRGDQVSVDTGQGYDASQINHGKPDLNIPSIDEGGQEESPSQDYSTSDYWTGDTYDYAAAAAAAAAAEAERQAREDEQKHRDNDKKIRDAEIEKQQNEKPARLYLPRSNVQTGLSGSADTWIDVDRKTGDIVDSLAGTDLEKLPRGYATSDERLNTIKETERRNEESRKRRKEREKKNQEEQDKENTKDHYVLETINGNVVVDMSNGSIVDKSEWWDPSASDDAIKNYLRNQITDSPNPNFWWQERLAIGKYSPFKHWRLSDYQRTNQSANELEDNEYTPPANQEDQPGEERVASGYNESRNNEDHKQQQASQPQEEQEERATTVRGIVDQFFRDSFFARNREAKNRNKALWRNAKRKNPDLTYSQFREEYRNEMDQEAFQEQLRPENPKGYRRINEYEQGRELRNEGQTSDVEDYMERRGVGTEIKDMHKLWRLLDQTTWDMRIGFFHVGSEKLVVDENGEGNHIAWSRRVEDAISQIMEDCGLTGIDGQRTVFRCVRLYATMAIDRQGKMFNENKDEWSLTQDEFIDICNCMHRSMVMWGHPFVAPAFLTSSRGVRKKLRGTDMFPSGVVPRVVAEALTGENSMVRFPKGHPKEGQQMTADDLIQVAHDEWIHRTQPLMNANLTNSNAYKRPKRKKEKVKLEDGRTAYVETDEEIRERNLVAQRIAIESALQAFARLDGMDAAAFGTAYNIDTAVHYRLWEYEDSLVEYATVLNGKYDSDAVSKHQIQKIEAHRAKMKQSRERKQVSSFEASCDLAASGIKTNALFWFLPVHISAIAERGYGNFWTWCTLGALRRVYKNPERFRVPDDVSNALHSKEGYDTVDAAYMLLEIGGPAALMDFTTQNKPLTQDEVIKYLHDFILRESKTKRADEIRRMKAKLNKASQKILSGSHAFKHSTMTNFLNALMISNQAIVDTQNKIAAGNALDDYAGLALTSKEMSDVFQSHNGDVAWFLSEVIGTTAGRDALIMMNANNISQFNIVGHSVSKTLRDHGIGNAAITAFLDSFPVYGVNFLYSMVPMSRTLAYLGLKRAEGAGDITAADFAMGGGFGERNGKYGVNESRVFFKNDPGFYNGLKMNLMFDCLTMVKWGLCGILIGGVMWLLGFEPPDDEDDIYNISKWKIGKNVGFGPDTDGDGKGNGVEIELCFWTNDLTQWGLPVAYAMATALSIPDGTEINGRSKGQIIHHVFHDSLADQLSGNILLDTMDMIKNWGTDVIDIDKTLKDPNHQPESSPFYALSELGLNAFGKLVPGAPLYKAWGKSAFLRGPEADMYTTNKTYDKSSDWAKEVGKTDYITDQTERLIRKYSAGNWLLAAMMNGVQMATGQADNGTGYFWHQMPTRSKTEPMALVLLEAQKMDYDNLPEGSTFYSYRAQRTEDIMNFIRENYTEEGQDLPEPEAAIRDGFFISGDIREAALNTLFSELNALENEWETRKELEFEVKDSAFYDALDDYNDQRDEIWYWINNWFKNDDIPTWTENYKQVLTSWDVTYSHPDGTPADGLEAIFDHSIQADWRPKGDNPSSMYPLGFSVVNYNSSDKVKRGAGGQSVPYWDSDSSSYNLLNAIGNEVINVGRDAGLTLNDVYYGTMQDDGKRWHEGLPTVGERSWYFDEEGLPESLRNINQDTCDGGIYGDLGKKNDKEQTEVPDKEKGPGAGTGGTKSFYPASSYGIGTKSNSGGNYSPKIYNTRVSMTHPSISRVNATSRISNTHISNSRVSNSRASNMKLNNTNIGSTRTSPNSQDVNNDRAASIGVRSPQDGKSSTYLNPNFETKGSREAYKRQDI